jgi:hypothetical protein
MLLLSLFTFSQLLTVVGTNLCAWVPLEVKGKGIRGVGRVAGKEACTVHTINIISTAAVLCRSLSLFLCR